MATAPAKVLVLYVDDEDINLFIFDELFRQELDVITTTSVEEAMRVLKDPERKINLVVTDLKMHPIGGMTFAKRVRDENINIPICILSAFPATQEITDAIAKGTITAFFNKPLEPELLLSAVKRLTDG